VLLNKSEMELQNRLWLVLQAFPVYSKPRTSYRTFAFSYLIPLHYSEVLNHMYDISKNCDPNLSECIIIIIIIIIIVIIIIIIITLQSYFAWARAISFP
jgi:hypothetical protein